MKNESKTKDQTTNELAKQSRRIAQIEESDTERKRIEETLQHRIDMEELIAGISTSFINLSTDEIDSGINHVLQKIGELADVDRSYVFQFYNNGKTMDNTHEWCAGGIEPQIRNLKGLFTDDFPWFIKKLKKFETIHVPSVKALPPEARAEKEILQMQGIKSIVNVPMTYGSSLIGFLGFDSVGIEKTWPDEDIRLLKMVGEILVNALERKQAEEKLKRSEEKYRDLFENANDAICIIDSYLKYKDVNRKTVEMLGYTREELLNMSVFDIIPPEQIPRSEIEFNKLRKKGSYETFVGKACTKDGRLIDVEVSSSAIKEGDKIIGSRDIIRDITERVQSEQALRESEERYRTIVEYSNDMIWILDTKGNFQFFNKRSEVISGYKLEDWVGKSFVPLIIEEDLPNVADVFHKTLEGQPQQYEVAFKAKNGSIVILSVITTPIYSNGKVVGTVSFGRDITEHKKAEKQIKESLKEKEVLLSEIYHRVKNNLQIIISLLRLQSRYVKEEEYREMFKDSQSRIMSMSLVHEKLYQSRDLARIDFKEYIEDMVKGLFQSYIADKSNISLNIDTKNISLNIDSAIPCGLIINELVTNSLKYAFPEGRDGKIEIALRSTDENMIELIVGDNGIGIPEDVDFKRTKSMGLHLVTMLAENQLHGKINLNRNKGTEFRIRFKEVK